MSHNAVDLTTPAEKPLGLDNIGISLGTRSERREESDSDKAISQLQSAVDLTPDGHPQRLVYLSNLGDAFVTCFERRGDRSALEQALISYSLAACAPAGPASRRFRASQRWIFCAHLLGHRSILDAYSVAIHLLHQVAWIGLSLVHCYRELVQGADMVREAAAAALDYGRPETAVEWLEQGRSIVWGQLLQLRSSHEELSSAYPDSARRLRELSVSLEHAIATCEKSFPERSDLLIQQEVNKRRILAIERDALLSNIRRLPDFERFCLHKEFSQLRALAHSGAVVILNVAKTRCDALIVLADVDHVIHVPLPNFTLDRCKDLQSSLNKLIGPHPTPRDGHPISQEDNFRWNSILSPLWQYVVKPVLDTLAFSIPGHLSRIFWCLTGPFTFLPIHAAGFYDAQHLQPGHKVFDFVISSYIPTLSILAPSPKSNVTPGSDLRLLAVHQPRSDGQSKLPSVVTELHHIKGVITPSSARIMVTESSSGTVEEVLALMEEADWVHFICDGTQDDIVPTNSGLCLANGSRLRISDIIALSRSHGGLAFLSAGQTAKGDKVLSDEAIHIAAGMLYAGYGGVIGMMWSINDMVAPTVTKDVYEQLFRNGTATPDYREAARALHVAVGRLRGNEGLFEHWLPFIHVGL